MSVVTQALPPGHYRVKHVVRSEIAKIVTLPSTAIMLGLTVLAGLVVSFLVTHGAAYQVGDPGWDPTQESLAGLIVAGLTAGVFGALLITAEYSSGTIRTSLAAIPRRPTLLGAKVGVTAAAAVVFCELLSLAAFFLGQAVLSARGLPSAGLDSPNALRAVLMTGLFIALLALMAFGFGLICRNTAGALASFVGVVFVLPLIIRGISEHAVRYIPTNILVNSVMSTATPGNGPFRPLTPTLGLLLMTLYAAVTLIVGAVLFLQRDA
jgi:ABC-2 type transport system permease protein